MPEQTPCRSCGAPLLWVVTAASGKRMPLDAEPSPDGRIIVAAGDVATVLSRDGAREAAAVGIPLYLSHFATCPNAAHHRKGR